MMKLCTNCKYEDTDKNVWPCGICDNNGCDSSKCEIKNYVLDFSGDDVKASPLKNGELVIEWEVPVRDNKENI